MAKRFTDTEIWDKEWFMGLSLKHKCLIRFIFDKCDVAGIWSPNWALASTYIGEPVTEADLSVFGDRIQKIAPAKFFVPGFISFQYGELSEKCKPHTKIISILKKFGLYGNDDEKNKGYGYPLQRVQEKEEEKEKEKEKEEGGVGETKIPESPEPEVPEIPTPEPVYASIDEFVNEEEFAAAVQFLKTNQMFTLIQMQRGKTADEALALFRTFYEQNQGFGKVHTSPTEMIKHFFFWTQKHEQSQQASRPASNPVKGGSKIRNLVHVAQNVNFQAKAQ
jgi:hypothetical protein